MIKFSDLDFNKRMPNYLLPDVSCLPQRVGRVALAIVPFVYAYPGARKILKVVTLISLANPILREIQDIRNKNPNATPYALGQGADILLSEFFLPSITNSPLLNLVPSISILLNFPAQDNLLAFLKELIYQFSLLGENSTGEILHPVLGSTWKVLSLGLQSAQDLRKVTTVSIASFTSLSLFFCKLLQAVPFLHPITVTLQKTSLPSFACDLVQQPFLMLWKRAGKMMKFLFITNLILEVIIPGVSRISARKIFVN